MSGKKYDHIVNIKLPRELDRRVKITEDDKEVMRTMYLKERMGVREIARFFENTCSRRSVQFVLFPERLKAMQDKHREEKHWKTFYNRKNLTKAVLNLRKYKVDLFKKGKII